MVTSDEELPSTGVASQPISIEIRRVSPTVAIKQSKKLVKQEYSKQRSTLLSHFLKKLSEPTADIGHSILVSTSVVDEVQQPDESPLTPAGSTITTEAQQPAATAISSSVPPFAFDTHLEMFAALQDFSLEEEEESLLLLHVLDTGGQPEYLNVVPSLLTGPALNLLVFRLTDKLEQRYEIRFVPTEGEAPNPYESSYTLEETLFQAYTSISCRVSTECLSTLTSDLAEVSSHSATLLVGTHKDQISKQDVSNVNKNLESKFNSIKPKTITRATKEKLIFAVDNTDPNDAGFIDLREALFTTLERDFKKVKLPLTWMMLYFGIKSSEKKILLLEQCRVIARHFRIDSDDELKLALQYLSNQFGVIR